MKRFKMFLAMAALACAIGLTVKYGSTYRPVVEPVRDLLADKAVISVAGRWRMRARRAGSRW